MNRRAAPAGDFRELPAYTISEAARYLTVPATTVCYWTLGRGTCEPLITVPDVRDSPTLISFLNLAELHVLAAIRRKHVVTMPKVRRAIQHLIENALVETDLHHPLLSREVQTDGLNLFTEQYGLLINISQAGQVAMREVVHAALRRIERDPRGVPVRLYPYTRAAFEAGT